MRKLRTIAVLILLLTAAAAAQPTNTAVFRKVFEGVTTAQASQPLPNIGQTLHLVTVVFPGRDTAVTSGLQVRIEASFDGTVYFPISPDITAAPRLGTITYQIEKAYAPWPYLRINSLTTTPAMTVYYSGNLYPAVSIITQGTDRFIL